MAKVLYIKFKINNINSRNKEKVEKKLKFYLDLVKKLRSFVSSIRGLDASMVRQRTVNPPRVRMAGSIPAQPTKKVRECGSSSVGRASAFQAEGRGFESRLPLEQKIQG